MLSKSRRKWFLRRILGPSLETGTVFDAVLSVNSEKNVMKEEVRASCAAHGTDQGYRVN